MASSNDKLVPGTQVRLIRQHSHRANAPYQAQTRAPVELPWKLELERSMSKGSELRAPLLPADIAGTNQQMAVAVRPDDSLL